MMDSSIDLGTDIYTDRRMDGSSWKVRRMVRSMDNICIDELTRTADRGGPRRTNRSMDKSQSTLPKKMAMVHLTIMTSVGKP